MVAWQGDDTWAVVLHAGGMTLALQEPEDTTTTSSSPTVSAGTTSTAAHVARQRRSRRLPRRVHQALLATHVLTAVGWFGLAVTVAFCGLVGSSTDDLAFYEVIQTTLWLSIPMGLGAAITGVVLSVTTRWGLARYWWVVAKEAITIAVIVTDVLVVGPTMGRAIEAGVPSEIPGPVFAHCVVLALATVLSVIKPKARTPLAARSES
jgi:hypothetical protein